MTDSQKFRYRPGLITMMLQSIFAISFLCWAYFHQQLLAPVIGLPPLQSYELTATVITPLLILLLLSYILQRNITLTTHYISIPSKWINKPAFEIQYDQITELLVFHSKIFGVLPRRILTVVSTDSRRGIEESWLADKTHFDKLTSLLSQHTNITPVKKSISKNLQ